MTRDEIEALLPFLANGTLEGAERAEVEAAVAADPGLAADLAALRAARVSMQADDVQSPGEFGLARLMREVGRDDAPTAANLARPPLLRRAAFWQAAAAILLAAVLVLGLSPEGENYELAGADDADFIVTFAPDATEEALRLLLLDAGVEIVAGPSALGLYRLAVLPGVPPDAARTTLDGAEAIVLTVEDATE